jgi:aromatic ring-opening dioxygenase catalytic subunit (LigB family)
MPVTTVKIIVMGMLMLAMIDAAIFGDTDVNGARGYYHCSDGPKCVHDYNDLPSRCYCVVL